MVFGILLQYKKKALRQMFNSTIIPKNKKCKCGCGVITTPGSEFISGHNGKFITEDNIRKMREAQKKIS